MRINSSLARGIAMPVVTLGMLLATAVGLPTMAHADSGKAATTQWNGDTFAVLNASSHPITYQGADPKLTRFANAPAAGTVFQPGDVAYFTMNIPGTADAWFGSDNGFDYHAGMRLDEQFFDFNPTPITTDYVHCDSNAPCSPSKGGWTTGSELDAMDPVGLPTIDVPATDQKTQTMLLNNFCYPGARGRCEFNFGGETKYTGDPAVASNMYKNDGPVNMKYTIGWEHTTTATESVTVTDRVGINLKAIFSAEMMKVVHHEVVDTQTDKASLAVTVPSMNQGWITFSPHMVKDTGDMAIAIGNSHWILHDVSISSKDPSGYGDVTSHVTPI